MNSDDLKLLALANMALNLAALGICVCRMRLLTPAVYWWVKVEYSTCATVLLISAFSPLWGEWPEWGQLGLSLYVLVSFLSSYFAWRNNGHDEAPDIVTDHAKLSAMKGHHD